MLRITNVTKNTILATAAGEATSWLDRGRGLLGLKSLPPGGGLLIHPCNSVHTMGMAFPIDIIHLDRDRKVLRVLTLPPWRLGPLVPLSRYCLELPQGAAGATDPGDRLEFIPAQQIFQNPGHP